SCEGGGGEGESGLSWYGSPGSAHEGRNIRTGHRKEYIGTVGDGQVTGTGGVPDDGSRGIDAHATRGSQSSIHPSSPTLYRCASVLAKACSSSPGSTPVICAALPRLIRSPATASNSRFANLGGRSSREGSASSGRRFAAASAANVSPFCRSVCSRSR